MRHRPSKIGPLGLEYLNPKDDPRARWSSGSKWTPSGITKRPHCAHSAPHDRD